MAEFSVIANVMYVSVAERSSVPHGMLVCGFFDLQISELVNNQPMCVMS